MFSSTKPYVDVQLPTSSEPGSIVDAHITTSSDYCTSIPPAMMAANVGNENNFVLTDIGGVNDDSNIRTYPNPTTGKVCLDFMGKPYLDAEVIIVSFRGEKIQNMNTFNRNKIDIDLSYYPSGIYMAVIKDSDKVITKKIIKK